VTALRKKTESARGGGEPKSVIDGKRRRLQCLRPEMFGGQKEQELSEHESEDQQQNRNSFFTVTSVAALDFRCL
jgi:hypothetical protein